jgi:hypothetical protein
MDSIKLSIMDNQRLLASAAVFRGLYSESLDQYDILSQFISATISLNNLHSFNISDCTRSLKSDFGFEIPEAVVRRCVKKKLVSELERLPPPRHALWHRTANFKANPDLQKRFDEAQSDNGVLTAKLIEHSEHLRKCVLSDKERASLVDDFFSHLKGGARQNDNFPLIGHFILTIQADPVFKQRLEHARQGLIIVDGLRYSTETSSQTLPQDLHVYLDTEVLFSAAGYHGSLREQLFKDLHSLVVEINKRADKSSSGKIRLHYFDATANEVENYFEAARLIVDKGGQPNPGRQAMATIINGCASGADVIVKKALFSQALTRYNIIKDAKRDFYDPPKFNLESASLIAELEKELNADADKIHQTLQQFTRINFLRRGISKVYFEAIGHIFLSEKSIVRAVSFSHSLAKIQEGGVSFATDLDYMTERFWLKLNKGFNSSEIPTTFDVLARTRLVLSAQLGSRVAEEYQNLQSQQNNASTRMDPETLGILIIDLMSKIRKPEDVTDENLDVEFLSDDDFISTALAEHATLTVAAESGRKAKEELHVANVILADERERNRRKDEAYEAERLAQERVRWNQRKRYHRREINLPVFRRTMMFAELLLWVYWCIPLVVISTIIYFMRAASDTNLSLFSAYWTVVPVFYGIQAFFWRRWKRIIGRIKRQYLSSKFQVARTTGPYFGQ